VSLLADPEMIGIGCVTASWPAMPADKEADGADFAGDIWSSPVGEAGGRSGHAA
jgi:hypothetical protein